jgi:hypothetical protein
MSGYFNMDIKIKINQSAAKEGDKFVKTYFFFI